jgi:hypothetical protein
MMNPHRTIRRMGWIVSALALVWLSLPLTSRGQDVDADGDGLSDFHEIHKHLTDPKRADSDGDGVGDADWRERREFQYTVRSVVQVMRPVTVEYLIDDYQDVRVLDETTEYVELEVIHYPFNTVAESVSGDAQWRDTIQDPARGLQPWLDAGPTSDWTPELRQEILGALAADGVNLDELDDRQTVERVSHWLLERAEYEDGFSTFITAFDADGQPYLPDEFLDAPGRTSRLTPEEQWARELSAAGMFRNRCRGSCSSSAIYLNGCLRAVGIPTRTILCIPIVDASDEREIDMLRRLKHPIVRKQLLDAAIQRGESWASHTFNEVFVGGRWQRLNYHRLGQNSYDPGLFGMMTHIGTFRDWADARMPETIGRRQRSQHDDTFGGSNPYSTISLRDEFGVHSSIAVPSEPTTEPPKELIVRSIVWTDSPDLDPSIRESCREKGRFGLIAEVTGFADREDVAPFLAAADLRVYMEPQVEEGGAGGSEPLRLGIGFDAGCYWLSDDTLLIYVPFGKGDQRDLVKGVVYKFRPRNDNPDHRWAIPRELTIQRD